jgi:hypothetical protein
MAVTERPEVIAIDLDLVGGLAGDMFVAAMVDALPELEGPVLAQVAAVRPAGAAGARFEGVRSGGLRALGFGLQASRSGAAKAAGRVRSSVKPANAHHAGTSYAGLRRRLEAATLDPGTQVHALALLRLLGEAEAQVHGVSLDAVHFHELADWDSLLDLVAAGCIAARLEGARWSASALPMGGGRIASAHGVLPIPGPATSWLLTGYPWRDDGVPGERVTPTGAAILRHLMAPEACGGPRSSGRLVSVGCGAGTRTLPGMPNVARAMVFVRAESGAAANGATENVAIDAVALIEFDVDDMTGEEIGHAAERLRAEPGVLDVSVGSRTGKKGRPLADFRLLVRPASVEAIARTCFGETTTLGLRVREEMRRVLARSETVADAGGARVRVKTTVRPGERRTAKAAHDDVAGTAELAARRDLRAKGEAHALGERGEARAAGKRGEARRALVGVKGKR